jgi:hypothetical protein
MTDQSYLVAAEAHARQVLNEAPVADVAADVQPLTYARLNILRGVHLQSQHVITPPPVGTAPCLLLSTPPSERALIWE